MERRKAERLLDAAHVKVAWTAPPSGDVIAAAARARLADELAAGEEPPAEALRAADDLLARVEEKLPARELLRRLLSRELERLPGGEPLRAVALPGAGGHPGGGASSGPPSRKRTHNEFAREGVAFRINIGTQDRADPRWLLPLICRRGGVTRREVGAIRIGPHETVFEIAGDAARDFALAAGEPDQRARHVVIERVRDHGADARVPAPAGERPARPDHAAPAAPPRPHEPSRSHEPPPPHQPPRTHRQPSPDEQPRTPRHSRPQPQQRSSEPPRPPANLGGGYHPLQRRTPSKHAPAPAAKPHQHPAPKAHEHPRPHSPKAHEHARPHPPKAHEHARPHPAKAHQHGRPAKPHDHRRPHPGKPRKNH
jgi:ATP-dependent RNA helicase DeaD